MGNKYLYIDDDNHENAVEKIDGLNTVFRMP